MQTREKLCVVYVVASDEVFKSLRIPLAYLNKIIFQQVNSPEIDSDNRVSLTDFDSTRNNYLIILDTNYYKCNFIQFLDWRIKRPKGLLDLLDNIGSIYHAVMSQYKEDCTAEFMRRHQAIKASKAWIPALFKSTNLSEHSDIDGILTDALYKKNSDANTVAIDMEWLTKDGRLHDNAPECVKEAYWSIKDIGSFDRYAELDVGDKRCMEIFMERHQEIKASKAWIPVLFKSTKLSENPDIIDILTDALHKKSSDANKVAIEMRWLTKDGKPHVNAPRFVKDAYSTAKDMVDEAQRPGVRTLN